MTDIPNLPKSLNPLLAGLPPYLKDPKSFEQVQRALIETMSCPTPHNDPYEMMQCKRCSENMLARRELLKRLGFKSPAQYMEWRRVHETIKKRVPLDKYNKIVSNGT